MDFEFDKEIDSLARQMAKGEIVTKISQPHLDADEISAFAENALPKMARLNAMEHLADCLRCRKILTEVISLNAEDSSEIIHAVKEPKTIIALPKIPWFRQLFAFPNLAYTMGALVLAFSGILGYVVLQSVKQDQNSSVAMEKSTASRPLSPSGASSDGDSTSTETYSTANTAANMAKPAGSSSNSANAATNPPVYATPTPLSTTATNTNSTAPVLPEPITRGEAKKDAPKEEELADKAISEKSKSEESKPENNKSAPTKSGNYAVDGVEGRNLSKQNEVSAASPPPSLQAQSNNIMTPDSRNAQRSQNAIGGALRENNDDEQNRAKSVAKKSADGARDRKDNDSKTIGGKTFRSDNGIWKDTAYNGGSTKNVKRSSDDYKKLDSGLRSIADNLGGTVIIVWKEKAYKIQ